MALFQVVRRPLDDRSAAAVKQLVAEAAAIDGYAALEYPFGAPGSPAPATDGFVAALAWDDDRTRLLAYTQAVRDRRGWELARAVHPLVRQKSELGRRLLRAVHDAVAIDNGADVILWVRGATESDDREAAGLDLQPYRELLQMRRPLPVDETTSLSTRAFRVGEDEAAWLMVNNLAFAWHPDQSNWTVTDIQAREREPWFDPADFLVYEREGELVGFCWTKAHDDTSPPMGEIYVIGVDPNWHGHGLGRSLVLAGLDHLARKGLGVGMLYVESTNAPALALYEDMGFTTHHIDRAYRR